jgi:hypothetical protein
MYVLVLDAIYDVYIESLKDICRRWLGVEQMLLMCPAV